MTVQHVHRGCMLERTNSASRRAPIKLQNALLQNARFASSSHHSSLSEKLHLQLFPMVWLQRHNLKNRDDCDDMKLRSSQRPHTIRPRVAAYSSVARARLKFDRTHFVASVEVFLAANALAAQPAVGIAVRQRYNLLSMTLSSRTA
jgi:hypothetical protein